MLPLPFTFASETARAGSFFRELMPWLLVLLGMIFAGAIVLYVIRRSITPGNSGDDEGFTLHDLRRLHRKGSLTDEEFERARSAMIERVTSRASGKHETAAQDDSNL
jgi:hypothetical protein